MGRTDAPPYLPGASHLYGEEAARSWRWRRSGSPATEPSGPVTKLDPLDRLQASRPQPIPAAHWTHGGLGGVKFPPCWLPDPPQVIGKKAQAQNPKPKTWFNFSLFTCPSEWSYELRELLTPYLLACCLTHPHPRPHPGAVYSARRPHWQGRGRRPWPLPASPCSASASHLHGERGEYAIWMRLVSPGDRHIGTHSATPPLSPSESAVRGGPCPCHLPCFPSPPPRPLRAARAVVCFWGGGDSLVSVS
jgi:hypothetical protein